MEIISLPRPIVLITIFYSLGIVVANAIKPPFFLPLTALITFLFLTIWSYWHKIGFSRLLLVICFLLGILAFQVKSLPDKLDVAQYADKGYLTVSGQVDNQLQLKESGYYFPLKVNSVKVKKQNHQANGTVYVLLSKELNPLPQYGEQIVVRGIINGGERLFLATADWQLIGSGGSLIKKAALWFRGRFHQVLGQIMPQKEGAILGSVLLGTTVSPISDETKDNYRQAGLIHLLVASGTQVSILIGICLLLFKTFGLPKWVIVVLTSLFNLLLVVVTGGGASILRAAILGEITLLGLLVEREKETYTALALSALVILIFEPRTLFDIGFQLSFCATWALLYIAPILALFIPQFLAITLAPLLATAPLIAFYFSQITFGAIIANLIILPWVEFLTILGFSVTLLGFIFLPLAKVLGGTLWVLLIILDSVAGFVASLPGACFYIPTPAPVWIIGYFIILLVSLEKIRCEGKLRFSHKRLCFIIIFLLAIAVVAGDFYPKAKELTVTFIDVGQGDAILVESPEGKKILIDGGEEKRKVLLPYLQRKGINRLNLMVATHPHDDHLGGLIAVLKKIKVDQVLDSGQVYDSSAYRNFLALIKANQIKMTVGRAGMRLNLGGGVTGFVLSPFSQLLGSTNGDSLVLRLVYGQTSFLLTGDLDNKGEEQILNSGERVRSTLLKVGHHGSLTATSERILAIVAPAVTIISCGLHNKFHHPHKATLNKLKKIKTFRTDQNGTVIVKSDGQNLRIKAAALPVWLGQ
jgi:competence protein ComEC